MPSDLPFARSEPRAFACRAAVQLDTESLLLSFDIVNIGEPTSTGKPALAAILDERLGVREPTWRISVGDLDLMLDANHCLTGGEIRSNPVRWARESLASLSQQAPPATLVLDAAFDSNGMASLPGPVRVVVDPVTHTVGLKLGERQPEQWVALADELLAGCTSGGQLCELRLRSPNNL